jgi:hypothetical protein
LIGVVLLFSATRLVFRRSDPPQTIPRRVRWRSVQEQGLVFFQA